MNKKCLYGLFGAFLLIFSLSFVMAANTATLNAPAADAIISDSINITSTLDTNALDLTNATFQYCIDNGGTCTDWVTIGSQVINITVDQVLFNITFDTTGIVDTINMTFKVNITDVDGGSATDDDSINVSIDNGNPTATLSSDTLATGVNLDPSDSFTVGAAADNTIGIESCIVWFDTTASSVITATNEACSASYTCGSFGVAANHNPTFLIQVTDDNGDAVNSSSRTVTCRGTGGGYNPSDFPDGAVTDNVTADVTDDVTIDLGVREGNFLTRFWNWLIGLFG